ncbi:MAG: urea carboxylase-associated family protein [Pseudomonadota bacterium]
MTTLTVPAAEGRAVDVAAGQTIRVTTPHGHQAADFFAYGAEDVSEWLSPMHTWVTTRSVKPRPGDQFLSRFRRPMLTLTGDTAQGCHDMLIAACDQKRYEQFGFEGHHRSCSENLAIVMNERGHAVAVTPQPVNFFTNTLVDPEGALLSPPNPVAPGAYVEMEALMDLICVVSSCPFDLKVEGWTINADAGPTDLEVQVG